MLSAHGSILFGNSVEKKSEWTSNFYPTVLAHTIRFFFIADKQSYLTIFTGVLPILYRS